VVWSRSDFLFHCIGFLFFDLSFAVLVGNGVPKNMWSQYQRYPLNQFDRIYCGRRFWKFLQYHQLRALCGSDFYIFPSIFTFSEDFLHYTCTTDWLDFAQTPQAVTPHNLRVLGPKESNIIGVIKASLGKKHFWASFWLEISTLSVSGLSLSMIQNSWTESYSFPHIIDWATAAIWRERIWYSSTKAPASTRFINIYRLIPANTTKRK